MRILLVAYDYPPQASPQAIRWYYLSRELARAGVEVHVLTPDIPARGDGALQPPAGVTVHRCDAGGLAGWLARLQRAHKRIELRVEVEPPGTPSTPPGPVVLNWKGRLLQRLDQWVGLLRYPDSRGLWLEPAEVALDRLLGALQPDLLISSHEPPVALQLGLRVAERASAWMVDLGDPVLTPYTSRRWRRRAWALEAQVCQRADAIVVTTMATRDLLVGRHAADRSRFVVIGQGFDDDQPRPRPAAGHVGCAGLRLLYTGRFYPFRDPTPLLEAVLGLERVSMAIVAPAVPPRLLAYTARSNGRIAFLGELPHARVLQLQRDCDVLVNIGNAGHAQTPGKLFEYLGSGRPILHCHYAGDDPANDLIADWKCGWSCSNDSDSLRSLLTGLLAEPQKLLEACIGDTEAIVSRGWSRLGKELLAGIDRMAVRQVPSAADT
jgi:hypothetical protein